MARPKYWRCSNIIPFPKHLLVTSGQCAMNTILQAWRNGARPETGGGANTGAFTCRLWRWKQPTREQRWSSKSPSTNVQHPEKLQVSIFNIALGSLAALNCVRWGLALQWGASRHFHRTAAL